MECPLQEHFNKTQKRPQPTNAKTVFGSCVHEGFKVYNDTGDAKAGIERFNATWKDPRLIGDKIDVWPRGSTYAGLRDKGVAMIKTQAEREKWENSGILAAEWPFCVPFGDHELRGFIDRIDAIEDNGGYRLKIIDYKTGKRPYADQLALNVQFTAYEYASRQPEFWMGYTDSTGKQWDGFSRGKELFEMFDGRPRSLIWYDLNVGKEFEIPEKDEFDYDRLYRAAVEVQKAEDAGIYVPNISASGCVFCPYHDLCPVMIPIVKRAEEKAKQEKNRNAS